MVSTDGRKWAYHGTDYTVAKKIEEGGFTFKSSDYHWLGNGVYFYLDYSLAKWWTSKPSAKFGTEIKDKSIIKCEVTFTDTSLDLMNLEHFNFFCNVFFREFWPYYQQYHPLEETNWGKIRCSYCDYLHNQYDFDMILGNFDVQSQPYHTDQMNFNEYIYNNFQMKYTEIQLCVFSTGKIVLKNIEKI